MQAAVNRSLGRHDHRGGRGQAGDRHPQGVNIGSGVDVENASGWVLVNAGDVLLAQVQVSGGTAPFSWDALVVGGHQVR